MNLRFLLRILVIFWLLPTITVIADELNLPDLGDSSSAVVSLQEEYQTGQGWLRAFRRQAPISYDPVIHSYLEELIRKLVFHSPLPEKKFSLVVVDNKSFNAFAVPGNVIGLNTGLFKYAETEDELAAVIAHELAHLSQRHYARSIDRQKTQSLANLAALLGSLLILANNGGDAGIAALTAAQAAAIDSQLKYSRNQEQEADRIGMQTLFNAQMNPEATAQMFQHMLMATRYRKDIRQFDFLLTHPLAENRVADALNQAREFPAQQDQDSLAFHVVKARTEFLTIKNPQLAVRHFQEQMKIAKFPQASEYGLAITLLANGQTEEAAPLVLSLYDHNPHQNAFILAKIDLLARQQKLDEAASLISHHLTLTPDNYPLGMKAAEFFIKANQPHRAVTILRSLSTSGESGKPDIWYALAEAEGLAGNIAEIHQARAEYFACLGDFIQAQRHLNLALPLVKDNQQTTARIRLRLQEIEQLERNRHF